MDRLNHAVRNFVADENGAALVEYGLLVALIAVVAIVVITTVGNQIKVKFQAIATALGG